MKKIIKNLGLITLIVGFTLLINSVTTFAMTINTDTNTIKKVYEQGIQKKKVNPNKYTFEDFEENYKSGINAYNKMKNVMGQGLNYDEWFEQILNFGAFPDGEGHAINKKKLKHSQENNAERFERDLRKGDIIVVEGDPGHAAIATTDKYILEMTGGGNIFDWTLSGISDNNHQFNKHIWANGGLEEGQGVTSYKWMERWVQIWRVPDRGIANRCANYADKNFWNTNGGYHKNIHIDYRLTSGLLTKNPNYCSKLVFQAYYLGSGSATVIDPNMTGLSWVLPSALPNVFTGRYAPYKVGTY